MSKNKYPRDIRRYPSQDWFTQSGAEALARQIRAYWAARGMEVKTRVVLVGHADAAGWYTVRSDMVGGLPVPREAETERAA